MLWTENEEDITLSNDRTFFELDVPDGAICKFTGLIKDEHFYKQLTITKESAIQLSWDAKPEDLDLHLLIELDGKTHHIFHGNMGLKDGEPWVNLNTDVQRGFGPEVVNIAQWVPGKYTCAVHNFSNDVSLSKSNAIIQLSFDGGARTYSCPDIGEGAWWIVFSYNRLTGQLGLINEIVDKPPSEFTDHDRRVRNITSRSTRPHNTLRPSGCVCGRRVSSTLCILRMEKVH